MLNPNPFEVLNDKIDRLDEKISNLKPPSIATLATEIINRDELRTRLGGVSEPTIISLEKRGIIPSLRIGSSVRYNWFQVLQALDTRNNKKSNTYASNL